MSISLDIPARDGAESDGPVYQQSGVIPWRRNGSGIEVLVITSRNGKRWLFPKGIIETEHSAAESAAKEAWEEAGVRGIVSQKPLGTWSYRKWGGICIVEMFAMDVTEIAKQFDEREIRERKWVAPEEARELLRDDGLRGVFEGFLREMADPVALFPSAGDG